MPKLTRLPLLFLAGERDEVIPSIHMRHLWASAEKASEKGFASSKNITDCSVEVMAIWNA